MKTQTSFQSRKVSIEWQIDIIVATSKSTQNEREKKVKLLYILCVKIEIQEF